MPFKRNRYFLLPLVLFVLSLLTGFLVEKRGASGTIRQQDIDHFSKTLSLKQEQIDRLINEVSEKLAILPERFDRLLFDLLKEYNQMADREEFSLLVSSNDRAVYWSDQVSAFVPEILTAPEGLLQLPNGWYLLSHQPAGPYTIHGLILLKYNYQINNNYLQNSFAKAFNIPDDYEVLFYNSEYAYPILDRDNHFLFSLKPSAGFSQAGSGLYFAIAFYTLALIMFFILIYRINNHLFHRYSLIKLLLLLLLLAGLYSLMNQLRLPESVFRLDLFSPRHFAYSKYWASLGEFFLFSVLVLFWAINFIRSFDLPAKIKKTTSTRRLVLMVSLLLLAGLFILVRELMYLLVMNSSISFAIYQITELNFFSLVGILSLGLFFLAFLLILFRTMQVFRKESDNKEFLCILFVVSLVLLLFCRQQFSGEEWCLGLFFMLIAGMGYFINKYGILSHRLSVIIAYVFVSSLFVLFNLLRFADYNEKRMQKLMVINLSEEHDPIAELYLIDIDAKIKTDTLLSRLLHSQYSEVPGYLGLKYFSGYFREYDLQVSVCEPDDSLTIQPGNEIKPCFPFFDHSIEDKGTAIADLNFYYVENMNGRITYLGRYFWEIEGKAIRLYIELNSGMLSEGTGFPELLLPQHSIESRIRNHFSFAKYNHGELVDRGGDFLYTLNTAAYQLSGNELEFRTWDGYEHCILNLGNQNYIIVSQPAIDLYDYFISFSYIFVFFFIIALIFYLISRPKIELRETRKSLRVRIQLTIIGVVLFTLLIVGGGTIYYNIRQFKTNHQQDLIDKINSISVELDMLLEQVNDFNELNTTFLNRELLRISEVFRTDINLFDLDGKLLATSRPEIFERGLISNYMNNTALHQLSLYQPTRYIHSENVGKLAYLSAYVPLINRSGMNIGYLNLPYFTHERIFRQQITNFVLAFVNIYVFLLMASILVAYYLSGRITDPLKLIRENLRKMQLGKSTEPIRYHSNDEIGLLVNEYNSKVNELANSAELLARNERELAWREMAKQIAHEIKNPLTPMKLNVQFLQRTGIQSIDDYQSKVNRVTETLIEQIDNLSAIASAFSNFAQMPNAKNEVFDLGLRLKEVIDLYENTDQCEIAVYFETNEKLLVYADREQFSRAIINLVRNAIQSIPDDRKGRIDVSLDREGTKGLITISDNGKGIDESLRESIFMPNFTTKSSGTGLGLAITKNIVQNFNGEIGFESTVGQGTTFFIRIPLIIKI